MAGFDGLSIFIHKLYCEGERNVSKKGEAALSVFSILNIAHLAKSLRVNQLLILDSAISSERRSKVP